MEPRPANFTYAWVFCVDTLCGNLESCFGKYINFLPPRPERNLRETIPSLHPSLLPTIRRTKVELFL